MEKEETMTQNQSVDNMNLQSQNRNGSKKELLMGIMIGIILAILGVTAYIALNPKTNDAAKDDDTAQEDNTEDESNTIEDDTDTQNDVAEDIEGEDCESTYTNNKLPQLTFKYNNCEWSLTEKFQPKVLDAGQVTLGSIELKNGENKVSLTFQPFMTNAPGWVCSDENFTEVDGDISRYTITAPNLSLTTYSYVLMENYTDKNSEGYEMLSGTSNFDTTKDYCYSNMNAWDQMITTYLNKDLPYAETNLPEEVLNRAAFADMGITVSVKDSSLLNEMESIIKSIEIK